MKNIYQESNQYNLGYITQEQMHYPLIKVSHKIDTKPNRQIADETINFIQAKCICRVFRIAMIFEMTIE